MLKTRLKTLFRFIESFAKVDQKFCIRAKKTPVLVDRFVETLEQIVGRMTSLTKNST